ncbi:ShlB/FhaC/HecB family hemolysin secretion/activation protein [Undibacterium pigrum]|uniref:Hemolysin activation/secretion protein n=1 Tax=Undibacterium pigrum TaxID=401470 RepID=A0A318J7X2_9BURK|nr:ShlB/FhaC/HecB family hemolysin secretion/activation protein [Undibacterium pigrum]PXX43243.1 hemolysin activation/secretion protein [Undibacterium pigrum]
MLISCYHAKRLCLVLRPGLMAAGVALACTQAGVALAQEAKAASTFNLPAVQAKSRDVLVTEFQFTGNAMISTAELQQMVQAYVGKRVSYAELEELRTRISRLYVERGYLNSGATLQVAEGVEPFPAGVVPVRLIEGRISEVRIRGEGNLRPAYLQQRLLRQDEAFNMPVLQQRFQLLLTDPLFEKINSRIIPGEQPGMAILDMEVLRAKAYGMNLYTNNYRAPSIGSQVLGVSGWMRNLSGYGDYLEASVAHSEGADPVHLGWTMPLNSAGTSLKLNIDQGSSSVVGASLAAVDIKSRSSGYELGLSQTLVNRLQRKVELGLVYSLRDSQTSLLGEAFSFTPGEPDGYSKTRVLRFSQEWTERWETQALALRSLFAFGRNNIDSSETGPQIPAQHYRIWTGQLQYVKNLSQAGQQIVLRASAQQTPDRLLPLERFSLGGVASVRGYRENAVVRDRAWLVNMEYHYPLPAWQDVGQFKLIAYTDMASASNKDESAQRLASIGAGVNWHRQKWSADLFLAKKLISLPGENSGNLQDHGLHFQLTYHLF